MINRKLTPYMKDWQSHIIAATKAGELEEAAESLFLTGNYSRKDFNKEEQERIEARAEVMSDDWDAGDYPGWRD